MGFTLNTIRFTDFRNYSNFTLDAIGSLTIFVGANAIGKTNIIEGIELITSTHSFRNPSLKQFMRWGSDRAIIEAVINDAARELSIKLIIEPEKKSYYVHGKRKSNKEIKSILPSIIFTPDDLLLIKGSNSIKRAALDAIGTQISLHYKTVKKDYEKILHHKNNLLKENYSMLYLESLNESFIKIASQLYCYRSALFEKAKPFIQRYYQEMTGKNEDIDVSYIPSWVDDDSEKPHQYNFTKEEVTENITSSLEKKKDEERKRRYSLIGPHNDKMEFYINGRNARFFGSQGQQRSLVLSFKLASVHLIEEITGKKPILLLDDVMSELDEKRRMSLLSFIEKDIQTFITTTDLRYFDSKTLKEATIIELG